MNSAPPRRPARHGPHLPREIADGVFWFSTCLHVRSEGSLLHNHNSCFLVIGAERTVLIDTGMPYGWAALKGELELALGGRGLDYIFPTHPELPHMGNIGPLVDAYPHVTIVGDLRNYHLYYPDMEQRCRTMRAGEALDLGGRRLVLTPAVIHDLPNSLWAYEPEQKILFVSDAYPFTHEHEPHQCGILAEELPARPQPEDCIVVIERALSWTRFVDAEPVIRGLHAFLARYPVSIIAPAHGGVIIDPSGFAGVFENGLRSVRGPAPRERTGLQAKTQLKNNVPV